MKILVVSNFYPPHYLGGYELGCRDVVEALKSRGHQIKVLTSTYGVGKSETDGAVYRFLETTLAGERPQTNSGRRLFDLECHNQKKFKELCHKFKPDVIYFWNMVFISMSLPFIAQELGLPTCFFASEHWFSKWENDPWYAFTHKPLPAKPLKRWLKSSLLQGVRSLGVSTCEGSLDVTHAQFCSQILKEGAVRAGKLVRDADVIHWSIQLDEYPFQIKTDKPRRLLYVGRVIADKGVHTAIEALGRANSLLGSNALMLTIAGPITDNDYKHRLDTMIETLGLGEQIRFTGSLSRQEVASLYKEHDVLIFPSIWEEPFGITPLEAMATGLAVVGTTTGGSAEIFEDGINALVFPKEDSETCAAQLAKLYQKDDLYRTLRENGRRTIETRFNFLRMADQIEAALTHAVQTASTDQDQPITKPIQALS